MEKQSIASKLWRMIAQAWRDYHWRVLGALGLLALILGWIGFQQQGEASGEKHTALDNLHLTLMLFALNKGEGPVGPYLEVARWLAPGVAFFTLLQTMSVIFRKEMQAAKIRWMSDHIVICGLNQKGLLLAESFREADKKVPVVIIEIDEKNELIETCRESGVFLCLGDASKKTILTKARVTHAKYLIAVCEADNINADIAVQARELLKEQGSKFRTTPLLCIVHLVNDKLRDLLEKTFIVAGQNNLCRMEFFNVYDSGARTLIEKHPVMKASESTQSTLHVLVLGLDWLGQNLLEKIIANRSLIDSSHMHVTVIGPQAETRIGSWSADLQDRLKLTVKGISVEKEEFAHASWLFHLTMPASISYVCLEDDNLTLSAALQLHDIQVSTQNRVVACLQNESGLASLLKSEPPHKTTQNTAANKNNAEQADKDQVGLQMFALLGEICNAQLPHSGTTERIAKAIHRSFTKDDKGPSWEDAGAESQESSRRAADHISVKLREVRCSIEPLIDSGDAQSFQFKEYEVKKLAEMEHARWWEEKKQARWSYADNKDNSQKKHFDCREWKDIGDESQEKNRKHIRALPKILTEAGYQIRRLDSMDITP